MILNIDTTTNDRKRTNKQTGIDTTHPDFGNLDAREVRNIYNCYGDVTTNTDGNGNICVHFYVITSLFSIKFLICVD